MRKSFLIFVFIVYYSFSFGQQDTCWEIVNNCNVYSSRYSLKEEIIFSAKANSKVFPLQKYGNQNFRVRFEDGQIGWINFWDIKQMLTMVVEDSVQIFNKPDYMATDNKYFQKGDSLLFLESNFQKQMVKVKSTNKTAWINEYYFISEQSKNFEGTDNSDYIVDYENFIQTTAKLSDIEFETMFNSPEAKIIDKNACRSLYRNIVLVKDKKYYNCFYLLYNNGKFLKDSIIGIGKSNWIEYLPLADFARKRIPVGFQLNAGNTELLRYIEKIKSESRIVRIIAFIFKWIIVITLFLIPSLLAYLSFLAVIRIPFLPNKLVKILNWVSLFLVFYAIYLFVILESVYMSPVFFSIFLILPFYYTLKKYVIGYNQKIDRHRCNSCGSYLKTKQTGSEFISKKHDMEHHSWRENLGSSTSIIHSGNTTTHVTTNFYQNKGASYQITWMYYNDSMQCKKCSAEWKVSRIEKKYGHI